jgi:hypothetical protein
MGGVRYRLVVDGELSARYATAFEGMELEPHEGVTAIRGTITDQAHLHGVLDRIASLGLTLVSVAPEDGEERPGPAGST